MTVLAILQAVVLAAAPAEAGAAAAAPAEEPPAVQASQEAASPAPREKSDVEVWNEGVDFYRAGDVTNALKALRPLMLTKAYGARAAEVVAKLEHERGDVEEAAAAAQIALRANPSDERANRNFTRAVDGLPECLSARRINAVLKAAEGKDPGAIMLASTHEARSLMAEAGGYATNDAFRAVALADSLSARARKLADSWIPVKQAICQSVTNEEQAATIVQQLDQAEAKTMAASRQLADMEPEAYSSISEAEHDFTRFLKMTIPPPSAMAEDLVAQSNAWQDVEAFNGRSWQQDALDYTRAFRARFPAWARAYEQQAQADTNKPPFTAEDQAKVSALATELEKTQIECVEKPLPPGQEKALDLIRQIQELLPKDDGGQGGQSGQDNPQKGDGQSQPPPAGQDQQQNQDQQGDDSQDDSDDKDGQDGDDGEEKPDEDDKEVEAVLKKAQERSDEHEAEKKARMRKAPLSPNERDW